MKLGLGLLIAVAVIVAGAAVNRLYLHHLQSRAGRIFGSLSSVCEGQPLALAHPSGNKRNLAAFAFSAEENAWKPEVVRVPTELIAERGEDVERVLCLGQDSKKILGACAVRRSLSLLLLDEQLAKFPTGRVDRYQRVQHSLPARLFSRRSGKLVVEGEIVGGWPAGCTGYMASESTFDGGSVGAADVQAWLTWLAVRQ